jgi:hypothetical protein
MKTSAYIFSAIIAISILAASCSKDDSLATPSSQSVETQKNIVASDDWRVSYYVERGVDQTSDFSAYSFQFNANGTLVVTGGSSTYTGTWNIAQESHSSPDDSGHHSSGDDDHKLYITITGNHHMDEITEDWTIVSISSSEMRLIDDNPESMEELRFVKK